jgi:flagellar protein FliO/FliZ
MCTKYAKYTKRHKHDLVKSLGNDGFSSWSWCHFVFFVLTLSCFPSMVYAAEPNTPSVGRLLLGLLFMIVLIFVGAWLVRRAPNLHAQGAIKIIASTSVGTRERIVLVQVGEQQVLVGVTAATITHLQTLANNVDLPATAPLNFQETLQTILKGTKAT